MAEPDGPDAVDEATDDSGWGLSPAERIAAGYVRRRTFERRAQRFDPATLGAAAILATVTVVLLTNVLASLSYPTSGGSSVSVQARLVLATEWVSPPFLVAALLVATVILALRIQRQEPSPLTSTRAVRWTAGWAFALGLLTAAATVTWAVAVLLPASGFFVGGRLYPTAITVGIALADLICALTAMMIAWLVRPPEDDDERVLDESGP